MLLFDSIENVDRYEPLMLQLLSQKPCRKAQPMSIALRNQSHKPDRRHFLGGSDARIIMGKDEKALLRLWREKRGELATVDLSSVLIVQLGRATEDLNRRWYELNSGHRV